MYILFLNIFLSTISIKPTTDNKSLLLTSLKVRYDNKSLLLTSLKVR